MFGKWNLLSQSGVSRGGALESETAKNLPAGSYTFLVDPPDGATSTLRLYRGNTELKTEEHTQMSFTMNEGDSLHMVINHVFNRTGQVSVQTDPPGVHYRLSGPNEQRYEGDTPGSYLNVPAGQYSVTFDALPGCIKPAPKSLLLEKDSRVSFTLKISCDQATQMREEEKSPEEKKFVTVTLDGVTTSFGDVPQTAWFAPYVFEVARKNVLSGYRDDTGKLTGIFGPENNVTIAELAKIAHRVASIDETDNRLPSENPDIQKQWFAPFMASAEQLGWTIYSDASIDAERPATRGEVLVTLLQVLNVPIQWQKGTIFTDVTARTPFAAAIETAAAVKIVSGKQDDKGKDTGLFGPVDAINRAEMAKIVDNAISILKVGGGTSSSK